MRMTIWRTLVIGLWIGSLWGMNTLQAQGEEPLSIQNIELKRVGEQLSLRLMFDSVPIYELHDNLDRRVLLLKFKNARFALPDRNPERLFNDPILEGIRFTQEGDELWAQIKARMTDLTHTVVFGTEPGVLELEFREIIPVEPLDPPPLAPTLQLKGVRFGNHPPDYTRATFLFVNSREPRMLILQDKEQKVTTIRFSDTHPVTGLQIDPFENERIRFVKMETDPNQTFITIESTTGPLEVREMYLLDPPRWVIDFYGEAREAQDEVAEIPEEEMTEEEKAQAKARELAARRERLERRRRDIDIRTVYNEAERAVRENNTDLAIQMFNDTYRLGRTYVAEFEDDFHPLASQSLFRVADVMFRNLERGKALNFHQAISAYQHAIRVAQENNIETDLIPHAYLQIGQSYRKMTFYTEANRTFDLLQEQFPNTLEAAEANFWRAVGQVDRREWRKAIDSFREYLRAGASPRHLAAAHYKMSQAYYQLRNFSRAKEGFDRARSIDVNYPNDDPTLLFHMGETYYETADFATAREVFNVLLRRYPDADFTKLVALRMGDFLRDEGKEEEAIQVYEQAATSFKAELALLAQLRIANILAQRPYTTDYQRALKVYDRLANQRDDTPLEEEAALRKGLTLTQFGHYQEGIQALEEFMGKYPSNSFVQRGIVQENIDENLKGLIDELFQREDYLGVVGVYKDYKIKYMSQFRFDTTMVQVGVAFQKLGLYDDAIDVFKFLNARDTSPLQELSRFQEAIALTEKGDFSAAREGLIRFVQTYPESRYDPDVRKQLASVYKQSREYLDAIQVYESTIKHYEQTEDPLKAEIVPELYYELGNLYNELGNHIEARQAYEEVPKHYFHPVVGDVGTEVPFYIAASFFLKGDMLFELKSDDDALKAFEEAIGMYRKNEHPEIIERVRWAQYKMGVIHQRNGEEEKALSLFKQLMDQEGNQLWKRLASENFDLLTQQMAYEDYLKE